MMSVSDAERVTGYHVGGISPFGQKKPIPTVIDEDAAKLDLVLVTGGQRGLQIEPASGDMLRILRATMARVTT